MNNQEAYNKWAESYDTVVNPTRDLEANALRAVLGDLPFESALELGCGTGKNTVWLGERAKRVTAVDFSEEMVQKARQKGFPDNISFIQGDIRKPWSFTSEPVDLITCSLILEHIEDLNFVFAQAHRALRSEGHFYIGELHPFKQYQGSKARFETGDGIHFLDCFTHHISDYTEAARKNGFAVAQLNEWFDENNDASAPRVLTLLLKKSQLQPASL